MSIIIANLVGAWIVAIVAIASWARSRADAKAYRDAWRASERECERVREVGLRTVEMWQAADKARAEGRSVNEALSPFLARPVSSRESEESRR